MSEKHTQYLNTQIDFQLNINETAEGVFSQLNSLEFRNSISNLLNNSIEANAKNIQINLKRDSESNYIVLSIIDDGEGIPSSLLEKVIEGGYSSKSFGSGVWGYLVLLIVSINGVVDVKYYHKL